MCISLLRLGLGGSHSQVLVGHWPSHMVHRHLHENEERMPFNPGKGNPAWAVGVLGISHPCPLECPCIAIIMQP